MAKQKSCEDWKNNKAKMDMSLRNGIVFSNLRGMMKCMTFVRSTWSITFWVHLTGYKKYVKFRNAKKE